MTHTKNFFAGFEYRPQVTRGIIYLNNVEFCNFWQVQPIMNLKHANQWACNRAGLALSMGLPEQDYFNSLEDMLEYLQKWYDGLENMQELFSKVVN